MVHISKGKQLFLVSKPEIDVSVSRPSGKLTVFNVGGNKVRVIAAIHYNRERIYIRVVLTHEEYDRGRWKE